MHGGCRHKTKWSAISKNLKIEQKYEEGVNSENLGCNQQTQSDHHK